MKTIATPAASQASIDLGVALRAARLDDRPHAGVDRQLRAVGEREERVGGQHRAVERQPGRGRLVDRDPHRVDAAHLPGADPDRRRGPRDSTIAFERTCLHTRIANSSSPHSSSVGLRSVDDLHLARAPPCPVSRSCTRMPPRTRLMSCSVTGMRRAAPGSRAAARSASARGPRARPRRSRARTPASTNIAFSFSASARSTGRLKQNTPPKALCGSVASALSNASSSVAADRRAARVVVLDDRRGRQLELLDQPPARVEVEQVVEGQLLAVQLRHHRHQVRARARLGVVGRALVRVLAVGQVEHLLERARVLRPGSRPRARRTSARSPRRSARCSANASSARLSRVRSDSLPVRLCAAPRAPRRSSPA